MNVSDAVSDADSEYIIHDGGNSNLPGENSKLLNILNNQNKPLGTRIFGPITSEFRKQKNFKIIFLFKIFLLSLTYRKQRIAPAGRRNTERPFSISVLVT